MEEIILIDKPRGMSSFGVIKVLRKRLGIKKIGHAGTLDPLASGLMIVGVGRGTKKLSGLVGLDKEYLTDIYLGKSTDTGDLEGKVTEEREVEKVEKKEVAGTLEGLEGEVELPVPKYSAVKMGGRRLYKKAREGENFEPPKRVMKIYKLDLLSQRKRGRGYVIRVRMKVGSGVYVRSVAEEIGRRMGVPAVVTFLRRSKIGKYRVEDAQKLETRGELLLSK